jgi:hypothetical protein
MPYLIGLILCLTCPLAAPLIIPTFMLLAVLQLICGTIDSAARAAARRRLRARLAAELRERRAIEARAHERGAFLRAMYAYARPPGGTIIEPAMRLSDQRASIVGRIIAYALVAALAAIIFGLAR